MKIRMTMFDPPSGWKYGFPKPMPASIDPFIRDTPASDEEVAAWLRKEKYPEHDIQLALKYSRMWEDYIDVDNGVE